MDFLGEVFDLSRPGGCPEKLERRIGSGDGILEFSQGGVGRSYVRDYYVLISIGGSVSGGSPDANRPGA
jgi:hypothetical protein